MHRLKINPDWVAAILSVCVQVPLAVFLGHYYDQTIFLQTGYLVAQGLNPYQPHYIAVFPNPYLNGVSNIIGYPPPWTFILGLTYRLTYAFTPNIYLYNFATKIPIIASNIALAYVTKTVMEKQNMPQRLVQFAWLFLLFNPYTLLTSAAWGEFDTTVALLCVIGVYLLSKGKSLESAIVLAVGFVLKPISLPLFGLPLLYAARKNPRKIIPVFLTIAFVVGCLWFLPFYLVGWSAPASQGQVSSYFEMAGGMTPFNIIDVFWRTSTLPSELWFLGYLWIPALLVGYVWVYRKSPKTLVSLTEAALVLLLIFFISRSWLSEQNLNLLFPFMLILIGAGMLKARSVHLVWLVGLVFLVLNLSLLQLMFLVYPDVISLKLAFDASFGTARLAARFAVAVVWLIVALGILYAVNRFDARKSLNGAPT
jgi:Predicted integral membrane protein